MSFFMQRPFDALAVELVELVLSKLNANGVLRASRVCQRFQRIVKSSARLQYLIELELEGLVEYPVLPSPSLSERIAILGRYKRCWNNLSVPKASVQAFDAEGEWLPAGRWLVAMAGDESSIRLARIPRVAEEELEWHLYALDHDEDATQRQFSTIALQGLDMLIVLGVAERLGDEIVPKISLLHVPNFSSHPLAARPELRWPAEAGTVQDLAWESMGLCGRSLAITLQARRTCVVWDWLTGEKRLVYTMEPPSSPGARASNWLLLAERTFCWTEHDDADGVVVLVVRSFDEHTGEVRPVGRWEFPQLSSDQPFVAEVSLVTDDADEIGPENRLDARFAFAPDAVDSVIGLTLVILTRAGESVHDAAWTFYAMRSTFLTPQATDDPVPWEAWGPGATRCVRGEAESIRGRRAVHGTYVGENSVSTSVMSFVRDAGEWQSTLYPGMSRGTLVGRDQPGVVDEPNVFAHRFETTLPFLQAQLPPDMKNPHDDREDIIPIPSDALMCWWEDGRVAWHDECAPKVLYVASL